jgi:hypothetical protein
MGTSNRNRQLPLLLPVTAHLTEVVAWNHPLLTGTKAESPAERLLNSWRKKAGYKFFFERQDIPNILTEIPDADWRAYNRTLDYFLEKPGKGFDPAKTWAPVPRRPKGSCNWHYHTRKNMEYGCSVNRFGWLVGAAAAAKKRNDPKMDEALFALLDDWIAACPAPEELIAGRESVWKYWYRPWAPLNTALRTKHWTLALHLLWNSPALTPDRFGRLIRSIRQHLVFLGRVPPRVDRRALGNHFLMETEGLLYASLWPWLKESQQARETALHNLERCLNRQILSDGMHCERTPGYHRGCIQWFALPLLLSRLNGFPLPLGGPERVNRMLNFGMHVLRPDGACFKSGDNSPQNDGWLSERLLAKLYGRQLPIKAPPPSGLLVFLRRTPKFKKTGTLPLILARHFPEGGFAAARSSWRPEASAILMKLDGYGGGHTHGDFLSFSYFHKGRLVVDEKGTWAYNEGPQSVFCKSAAAHSLLLLGRRELLNMGNPRQYFFHRPPAVKMKDIFCKTSADGSMKAGGRTVWPDGAWWRRELSFNPEKGLEVTDEIYTPKPEAVRLQFYVPGGPLQRVSPSEFHTKDAGLPHVRFRVFGEPALKGSEEATTVYNGFFTEAPARRLVFLAPALRQGRWQTTIENV